MNPLTVSLTKQAQQMKNSGASNGKILRWLEAQGKATKLTHQDCKAIVRGLA